MAASLLDGLYQAVSESTTRIKKELFAAAVKEKIVNEITAEPAKPLD
jgi:hypothetical protein